MRVQVIGVKSIAGTSSKTGNPFEICNLFAIVPIQAGGSGTVKVVGHGLEVAEIPLDPSAISAFAGLPFPLFLDLKTDARPYMGKLETFVTGFAPVQQAKAA